MISSIQEDFMLLNALPEKSPWVAKALTLKAPSSFNTFEASQSVPAVSMISSMMMACLFYTFPTRCMLPILPAPYRCLMIMAKLKFQTPTPRIIPKKFLALATPPASGDTTTISLIGYLFCSTKQFSATNWASRLSTGTRGPKNLYPMMRTLGFAQSEHLPKPLYLLRQFRGALRRLQQKQGLWVLFYDPALHIHNKELQPLFSQLMLVEVSRPSKATPLNSRSREDKCSE